MADMADRNTIVAAAIKPAGALPEAVPAQDGDAAGTRFNHFAERVLPTLRQLRAARKIAETLVEDGAAPAWRRIGNHALDAIRSIDATLRTTGVYDLSELTALEGDATRMNAVCCVLDEVGVRLRALARDLAQQAAQLTVEDGATRLTPLSAVCRCRTICCCTARASRMPLQLPGKCHTSVPCAAGSMKPLA